MSTPNHPPTRHPEGWVTRGLPCTSEEAIAEALKVSPKLLMAFSTGKDCIGAYLAIRDAGFEQIEPYYMYQIPGNLEFIEESLDYYERTLFRGQRIHRIPHPFVVRGLNDLNFQPPERCRVIELLDLEEFDAVEASDAMKDWLGWPEDAMTAVGVRAADSPVRYSLFRTKGMDAAVNTNNHKFYPVFDWTKARLVDAIRRSGVKLPVDYRIFGKTFDGLDIRFLKPLKEHFPRDYQRVLEWFPLAELELFRYERRHQQ